MKIREETNKVTVIYIPPAGRPIRKSFFSRTSFYFLTALTLLIFISLLFGQIHVYLQSKKEITLLNQDMHIERRQSEQIVNHKDRKIEQLRLSIFNLSQTAEQIEARVEELKRLELELKRLSNEINMDLNIPNYEIPPLIKGTGGESIPVNDNQILELVEKTRSSFVVLDNELVQLSNLFSTAQTSLEKIEEIRRHIPSIRPTPSNILSSGFGIRKDPFSQRLSFHNGIDIPGKPYDQIYAAADGIILDADWDPIKGSYIQIDHTNELQSVYMHLQKITVKTGDLIQKGEVIGYMGSTGRSTGTHLHYEVHLNGQQINPIHYIEN